MERPDTAQEGDTGKSFAVLSYSQLPKENTAPTVPGEVLGSVRRQRERNH